MVVKKEKSESGLNVFLEKDGKQLGFTFGGNGDLYWLIKTKNHDEDKTFVITKENYGIYDLFEQLFEDIKNINIFELDEDDLPYYIETELEKLEYLEELKQRNESEKIKYRELGYANYHELFDEKTKTITWYSDETAHEVANILKIRKEDDRFIIEFSIQPHLDGYDEDFHKSYYIPIRFRNSGSSYSPFNIVFMRMYNAMKEVDDINDIGHQIHIEEYIYAEELKLTRKKH
ncbi:MAG: hypothetical protein IKR74_00980 [Bacilli bacterium]|nr:hypothetical protein [Bacilli bacterium]